LTRPARQHPTQTAPYDCVGRFPQDDSPQHAVDVGAELFEAKGADLRFAWA
jgi:hypothetical protein